MAIVWRDSTSNSEPEVLIPALEGLASRKTSAEVLELPNQPRDNKSAER